MNTSSGRPGSSQAAASSAGTTVSAPNRPAASPPGSGRPGAGRPGSGAGTGCAWLRGRLGGVILLGGGPDRHRLLIGLVFVSAGADRKDLSSLRYIRGTRFMPHDPTLSHPAARARL